MVCEKVKKDVDMYIGGLIGGCGASHATCKCEGWLRNSPVDISAAVEGDGHKSSVNMMIHKP